MLYSLKLNVGWLLIHLLACLKILKYTAIPATNAKNICLSIF